MFNIKQVIFRLLLLMGLTFTLTACGGGDSIGSGSSSSSSTSGDSSSGSSYGSKLQGTWKLVSPDPGGTVTISFSSTGSSGTGQNVIDVSGYAKETRSYTYSISGSTIYFKYTNTSGSGTPSKISSLTSSTLKLYNSDNTTGTYTKVGSSGSDSGGSSGSTKIGITVWNSVNNVGNISVYIDGQLKKTLTGYYGSSPGFGAESIGAVTTYLPVGNHTVKATSSKSTWKSTSYYVGSTSQLVIKLQ